MKIATCIAALAAVTLWILSATHDRPLAAPSPHFAGLGDLPGGFADSLANAVSADGSVVIGYSNSARGIEAFRWDARGGIVGLGFLDASGVSADGAVIVGRRPVSGGCEPVCWTSRGVSGLHLLPGQGHYTAGEAMGISADGSCVVGNFSNENDPIVFRGILQSGIVSPLDPLGAAFAGEARAVSADGATVVGVSFRDLHHPQAFRWTRQSGVIELGMLPDDERSTATAVSADGSVVVGWSESIGQRACCWTQKTGLVALATLPGDSCYSAALGISADGSIIVGHSYGTVGLQACIWDVNHKMRTLRDVLVNEFNLEENLRGWKLLSATGVSADGTAVAGFGLNPNGDREAFVAHIGAKPPIGSPAIELDERLARR